jgi:hypothetical protein
MAVDGAAGNPHISTLLRAFVLLQAVGPQLTAGADRSPWFVSVLGPTRFDGR